MYKVLIFILVVLAISCKHEPLFVNATDPTDTIVPPPPSKNCDDSAYFNPTILNLISSSCAQVGCHDQQRDTTENLDLSNYTSIMNGKLDDDGTYEKVVIAGNAASSKLYEVLIEEKTEKRMPPPQSTVLTQDEIDLIKRWINEGAKNNTCYDCDTVGVTFSTHVYPIIYNNCRGCHGSSPSGGASTSLMNHAQIVSGVTDNNLLERIKHIDPNLYDPMPYSQSNPGSLSLSPCQIRAIEIWINAGMNP